MDFQVFKNLRAEHVEWMAVNGYNEGDCNKNGEFFALDAFAPHFDLFVDIGSNFGIFIDRLLAKSLGHYIVAFEPNPYLRKDLLAKITRGQLVQCALSNSKGVGNFNVYEDSTTSSLLDIIDMMPHFTKNVKRINVEIDILDNYINLIEYNLVKACMIKIDAEGAEFPILLGASSLLKKISTIFLMFEYSSAWEGVGKLKDAFHMLDELGFKMYRITPFGLESLRFYTPQMDSSFDYCNYFAIKGFSISDVFCHELIPSSTHVLNKMYLFPRD